MIQPAFDIGNEQDNLNNANLLMEVGEKFFNYIIYREDPKQLVWVKQYAIESTSVKTIYDQLEQIISDDPLLQQAMNSTAILYNFPESNLIPEAHFDISLNKPLTQLIYGDAAKGLVLSEKISGWRMYNSYRVPKAVHTLFQRRFHAGKYWHFYSLMLSSADNIEATEGATIRLVFYNDKFIAAFFAGGDLLLLQTFTYQTPEDAAYYLLLMCRRFGIAQENTVLQLSGLIDEHSTLYSGLTKYFPIVEHEGIPEVFDAEQILRQYPSHYFSPLLKISLCV